MLEDCARSSRNGWRLSACVSRRSRSTGSDRSWRGVERVGPRVTAGSSRTGRGLNRVRRLLLVSAVGDRKLGSRLRMCSGRVSRTLQGMPLQNLSSLDRTSARRARP